MAPEWMVLNGLVPDYLSALIDVRRPTLTLTLTLTLPIQLLMANVPSPT